MENVYINTHRLRNNGEITEAKEDSEENFSSPWGTRKKRISKRAKQKIWAIDCAEKQHEKANNCSRQVTATPDSPFQGLDFPLQTIKTKALNWTLRQQLTQFFSLVIIVIHKITWSSSWIYSQQHYARNGFKVSINNKLRRDRQALGAIASVRRGKDNLLMAMY